MKRAVPFVLLVLLACFGASRSSTVREAWRRLFSAEAPGAPSVPSVVPTSTAPAGPSFLGDRARPYTFEAVSGEGARTLAWQLAVDGGRVYGTASAATGVYDVYGTVVTSTDQLVFSAYAPERYGGDVGIDATGTWRGAAFDGTVRAGDASTPLRLQAPAARAATIGFQQAEGSWQDPPVSDSEAAFDAQQASCEMSFVLPTVEPGDGIDAAAAERINRTLRAEILATGGMSLERPPAKPARTAAEARDAFLRECRREVVQERSDWREANGDDAGGIFRRDEHTRVDVALNRDGWLSLVVGTVSYSGGAHGLESRIPYVFDTRTGATVGADELVRPESRAAFGQAVGGELLRAFDEMLFEENAASLRRFVAAPPAEAKRLWAAGESGLPTSTAFYLLPTGLRAVFQQYEVAPYAAGIPEVFLPYASVRAFVRPGIRLPL